jgi:hypothetical protein
MLHLTILQIVSEFRADHSPKETDDILKSILAMWHHAIDLNATIVLHARPLSRNLHPDAVKIIIHQRDEDRGKERLRADEPSNKFFEYHDLQCSISLMYIRTRPHTCKWILQEQERWIVGLNQHDSVSRVMMILIDYFTV